MTRARHLVTETPASTLTLILSQRSLLIDVVRKVLYLLQVGMFQAQWSSARR